MIHSSEARPARSARTPLGNVHAYQRPPTAEVGVCNVVGQDPVQHPLSLELILHQQHLRANGERRMSRNGRGTCIAGGSLGTWGS